jgi:hypothetical protein
VPASERLPRRPLWPAETLAGPWAAISTSALPTDTLPGRLDVWLNHSYYCGKNSIDRLPVEFSNFSDEKALVGGEELRPDAQSYKRAKPSTAKSASRSSSARVSP